MQELRSWNYVIFSAVSFGNGAPSFTKYLNSFPFPYYIWKWKGSQLIIAKRYRISSTDSCKSTSPDLYSLTCICSGSS
ncbi:hypothetical protein Mp_zg00150 [Marchantia polymorpha subsp. ruderalis]|uniref:Uncharacterized protein n=2 Tax=Marchantia polymorpha TaxID=3197 RepID=A0A679E5Q5_MARPO|nr:hypothetical protein MARPO_3724s0001 [Marchantia polymorpha]BBN20684.1 hypothetical protein Mp_zg00150 [Marchantia polymorpha subsp. ruderalis]|eukprot:PTQ26264.1 hypothetical protein MARPO_3724s0001 [Marchantia polymorpha]